VQAGLDWRISRTAGEILWKRDCQWTDPVIQLDSMDSLQTDDWAARLLLAMSWDATATDYERLADFKAEMLTFKRWQQQQQQQQLQRLSLLPLHVSSNNAIDTSQEL